MSCSKVDSSLLQDLLDQTIDPLEKIFVENHLLTCKDCRRELSELKLMLWELEDKSNYEIEYPAELNTLGNRIIDDFMGEESGISTAEIIDMQLNTMKLAGNYVEYMPGAKYTSQILKKASKGLASEVKKLISK
jgi:hypothetical protein